MTQLFIPLKKVNTIYLIIIKGMMEWVLQVSKGKIVILSHTAKKQWWNT